MQRRKYLSIILILIMLFAIFIFAAAEDELGEISSDSENTAAEEKVSEEEIIGNIEAPTNVNDLLNYFERLEGNWVVYENDELIQDTTVTYEYLSQENIMGEKADKVSIEIHDLSNGRTPMYFWIGEEEILQMEMENLSPLSRHAIPQVGNGYKMAETKSLYVNGLMF